MVTDTDHQVTVSAPSCPNHRFPPAVVCKGVQEDGGGRERKQLKADISPATREAVGRYVDNLNEAGVIHRFRQCAPLLFLTSHLVLNYPGGTKWSPSSPPTQF